MPSGDRTGPNGMGPLTGRRAGYCAGYPVPGYMNSGAGRGFGGFGRGGGFRRGGGFARGHGFGRGAGYGWGYPQSPAYYGAPYENPYVPPMTSQQQVEMLKQEADALRQELDALNRQIKEMETGANASDEK